MTNINNKKSYKDKNVRKIYIKKEYILIIFFYKYINPNAKRMDRRVYEVK